MANIVFYVGPTGQTLYVRLQNPAGNYVATALTEGTSGGEGKYTATEATIAGLTGMGSASTGNGCEFRVFVGAPSTTATDPIVAYGFVPWSGSAELPTPTRTTAVAAGAITSAGFANGALDSAGTLATGTVGGVTTPQQFSIGSVLGSTVVSGQLVVFRNVGGDVSINRVVEFDSGSGELQIDQNASYTVQVGDSVTIYPFDHPYQAVTNLLGRTNGSATVGTQLARLDTGVSVASGGITSGSFAANSITASALASDAVAEIGSGAGAAPDTRDLQPVQFMWKLSRRSESTLVSTNTLHIAAGESIRCGFDCDNTIVLPGSAVLGSMTDPTDTGDDLTAVKLGIDPKVAKVEVSADANAAAGTTEYYVRTTVLNDNGAGPITLIGKVKIVADPTQ